MESNITVAKVVGLGLDPRYKGFVYILEILCNKSMKELLTSTLESVFFDVAEKFGVLPKTVEHALLALLRATWSKQEAAIHKLFASSDGTENECPTLRQFVYTMKYYVELGDTDPLL